ncbi:MAG TPA: hypothetical protein VFD01_19995 [Candidatus Dormibacteraeota bacterium]|jgi:hypothetical protein|nr:hypothetical protein [Candidatus Dormibacteraeota bacterium]
MEATSTFTGTAAGVAVALCVINTLLVLFFLVRIWLQDWLPWRR